MQEIINNINVYQIFPYERNARKNDHAVDEVIKSIERVGYRTPIIVDENNVILCGHTRYKAIVKMGWAEIPFIVRHTDLTEEQKKEYRIRDNKTGEIAEWDFEILEADFSSEELIDFGFDIKDLTQPEVEEDEAPPVPEIARTVKGDIYTLGNHRVMCGDSTMIDDVEKLMDGKKADMVFTDPPYGVSYTGGLQFKNNGDVIKDNQEMIKNDETDDIYSNVVPIISTICNGACYIWFAGTKALKLYSAIESVGDIHSLIIWVKNGGYGALNANYKQKHEPCLYWKPKGKTLNFTGGTTETTVWNIDKDGKNKMHPTQKPVELSHKAIMNHSAGLIVDLFLGSGSTLIACEQTNRICYGMELDEKYCDVIVQRWVNFTGGKVILNGQEIEWSKSDAGKS
jgi:DNA modification methylase